MLPVLFISILLSFYSSEPKLLKDLRWENRVLILFEENDLGKGFWEKNLENFKERRMAVFYVSEDCVLESNYPDEIAHESLNRVRKNKDSSWILIGLDGAVKDSGSAENFDLSMLWRKIDSMPMRQSEIRKKGGF